MKRLLHFVLFLSAIQSANGQTFNPLLSAILQDTLDTYVSSIPSIKGMSASVYLPGQGIWQGVSGESFSGQPITPDMEFGIASNSKLFVSVALLELAEHGIINLDDSLHEWIPAYANINPNITIRQLLNHTSGVHDPLFSAPWMDTIMANPTRVFTPEEVIGWVGTPLFDPGTSWGYSNPNYILAGMIAQSATGFSISKIIRDSLLTPLDLDSTFYDVEEPEIGSISHRWWNSVDYHDTSRIGLNSAGGASGSIFSTSSEMAQWYNALFNGQLLSPSSMAELTTFIATGNPSYNYGLGLSEETTNGLTYFGHGGDTWGYKSKMMYDTCMGMVVCGLSNSFPSGVSGVTFLLFNAAKNYVPGCPGEIAGLNLVCQGQSNVTYTIPSIANATSYVWTLPNGATGTSSTNSITANFTASALSGDITVRGENSFGVGNTSALSVIVNVCEGLSEAALENNEMYIYPNPFSEQATLRTKHLLSNATLTIDNCFGRTVQEIKNISGETVNLYSDNLTNGLYFIRLTDDTKLIATTIFMITD